mmetsp:Transcript_66622/g.124345  ORF Transcript_66622/g.124345 Transcript_66622/m.124345 type:complete len:187 (+) Transcript_66622:92-652(+)
MGNKVCCEAEPSQVNAPVVDSLPVQSLGDAHTDQVIPEVKDDTSYGATTAPVADPPPAPAFAREPEPKQAFQPEAEKKQVEAAPPVEPPTPAKPAEDEEYTITLERAGNKLGMLVYNQAGEEFIRVRTVREGWLVDKWNAANPTRALKPGYTIVEVNGRKSADDMRWVIGDAQQQTLSIRVRPVQP